MHTSATTHPPPPPRTPSVGLVLVASVVLTALLGFNEGTAVGTTAPTTWTAVAGTPAPVASSGGSGTPGLAGAGSWLPSTRPAGDVRFDWPLPPPHPVLRPFQPPSTPYGPGHRGVDLGGYLNEPVLAAGDGLVLYAGPLADRSVVSIEHPGGLRTTYEPVQPSVRVGDEVRRGQVIGLLMAGHPGCAAVAPAVCLHWGAHRERVYLDPLRLVETGRIRLLPWLDGLP
jgi:murein DD-endopeptidase MepM/ murein hydrolase activator NlpD